MCVFLTGMYRCKVSVRRKNPGVHDVVTATLTQRLDLPLIDLGFTHNLTQVLSLDFHVRIEFIFAIYHQKAFAHFSVALERTCGAV